MLQKPDVHTEKMLELATFLENLEPERFSMGSWGQWEEPRCICGWYQHLHGHIDKENWRHAADGMGLDHQKAHYLFTHGSFSTPQQAAKALRHLAVTGEVR
jgi:hypothetical protein